MKIYTLYNIGKYLEVIKYFKLGMCFFLAGSLLLIACNKKSPSQPRVPETIVENFQNMGHELVYKMVQKVGTYNDLLNRKDVSYVYTYSTPDGKQDISYEKYIFDGELSFGSYTKHERTIPELSGVIEQGYDGTDYWLRNNCKNIEDFDQLKKVAFNRPTNFYWFAMMQKLLDPGLSYEHLGDTIVEDNNYDVVKVTFDSEDNKPKDIYQLYINKKTSLVDQFLFTVADFGVIEKPLLMRLKYKTIDGLLIPCIRKYKSSTWDAEVSEDPWITVEWSGIEFNTNISKDIFTKKK